MPDITKCQDSTCPKKDTCYRWTAPASDYQSYFAKSPRVGAVCFYHWRTDEWAQPRTTAASAAMIERDAEGMPVRFYPETRKD